MADKTAIEWCDATLNLWWGCTKVSEGCKHCYADTLSHRYNRAIWGPKGTRVEVKGWRSSLNKISKRAKDEGRRLKVFCQSMSDTFEGPETCGGIESENWRTMQRLTDELLQAILDHPHLDFLLLTKRPENVMKACHRHFSRQAGSVMVSEFPPNLWMGTSVENQETADKRIPELLKIPAKVRFLSCEPLIGPVDLDVPMCDICYSASDLYPDHDGLRCAECDGHEACYGWFEDRIHWVICGGESGPKARPMHPNWARSLRGQCQEAGVLFFFKQWGEWAEDDPNGHHASPHNGWVQPSEEASYSYAKQDGFTPMKRPATLAREGFAFMTKVGKKAAGSLLDGQEWKQFPGGGQ